MSRITANKTNEYSQTQIKHSYIYHLYSSSSTILYKLYLTRKLWTLKPSILKIILQPKCTTRHFEHVDYQNTYSNLKVTTQWIPYSKTNSKPTSRLSYAIRLNYARAKPCINWDVRCGLWLQTDYYSLPNVSKKYNPSLLYPFVR